MDSILQIVRQEEIEARYNRKHIDKRIREEIKNSITMQEKIEHGVTLLTEWLGKTYYASKEARLEQIRAMDTTALVESIFLGITYCQTAELFTSVTAQMSGRLGFDDKKAAITTVAEIIAVLCNTDAFDINKAHPMASLMVVARIPLSEELQVYIRDSQFLPPMVCVPLELESNYDSGYLSHNDSLILGVGNHHDGNICLDVLNTMNKVELKLDLDFLCKVEEDPTTEFTVERAMDKAAERGKCLSEAEALIEVERQVQQWKKFKSQSYEFYSLMHRMGNQFHLTHKVDKRGRIYASGFHINTQGTPFKKAMIELSNEEFIEGVPV